MSRFSRASAFATLFCMLFGTLGEARAWPENAEGWRLLLDNEPVKAQAAFQKNVANPNPKIAGEALRGQARAAFFLGDDNEMSRLTFESFRKDGDTAALLAAKQARMTFARNWDGRGFSAAYDVYGGILRAGGPATTSMEREYALRLANDGDLRRARDLDARSGIVRDWWAIGPFANFSGSGFEKVYPPEREWDMALGYNGKNGNKVIWFPVRLPSPASWIFSQNHLPSANAVLYFAAQFESHGDRPALLAFGASGSFKVFLNDSLVLAERVIRNTGEDNFVRPVSLKRGKNRLLVKLGNEDRYSNFQLRLLDPSGRGLTGLTFEMPSGTLSEAFVGGSLQSSPYAQRHGDALRARLAADPADEDAAVLLEDLYLFPELTDSAEALCLRRLARNPNSALWHHAMAEVMFRSRQQTRAQEHFKAAQRLSPLSHAGWQYEVTRLGQSAGPEVVLDFLRASPEAFRLRPDAQTSEMIQLARLNREGDMLKVFAEFEKQSVYDYGNANLRAYVYKAQGRRREAEGAWTKFIAQQHTEEAAYVSLADIRIAAGDVPGAFKALEEGREYAPNALELPLKMAGIHMQVKQYREAAKQLDEAEGIAPTHPSVLISKANLFALTGNKEAARASLLRSLDYNYNDFSAWENLRELDGQPSFESMAPLPKVDSVLRAAAAWDGLKREKGSLVSWVEDVFYYSNHAARHRTFMVMHLPTQEAVNRAIRFDIPHNGSYQTLNVVRAVTHKKSGSEVDAEIRDATVVFKSLEPGDAIVMEWTLKDSYEGDMARQVWGQFKFRQPVPVYDARLRFYMAGADTIGYSVRGSGVEVAARDVAGVRERVFSRAPLARPAGERYVAETDATSPDVVYSTFGDWGRIADWYADLTDNKSDASPSLRRLADSLFRDAKTDAEKVARVQQFVSSAIAYSSLSFRQSGWIPQSAREVLASRLGDCKDKAALAKSLLELAGIESHLVLVATRDEFGTRPGPVGPHFNHCILAYKLGGKERFMELTDTELFWSRLSKYDQGAVALVARKGNRELIRLPMDPSGATRTRRTVRLDLAETGDLTVVSETVRSGLSANATRNGFRHLSAEERRVEMQSAVADDYPDVRLDTVWFGDMDPSRDSLRYGYGYSARQAAKAQGRTRIFKLSIPDDIDAASMPSTTDTTGALDMYTAWYSTGTFDQSGTLRFPAGWKLLEVPAPIQLKSPFGEYSLTFKAAGNQLTYSRKAVFRLGQEVPHENTPALRAFMTGVSQADDIQLLFTKP